MKNLLLIFSLTALFSVSTIAADNYSTIEPWACEHCAKDHKCDDKCKEGEKSACCKKADEKKEEAVKSCCKKGKKSCKKDEKSEKENDKDKE